MIRLSTEPMTIMHRGQQRIGIVARSSSGDIVTPPIDWLRARLSIIVNNSHPKSVSANPIFQTVVEAAVAEWNATHH